VLWQNKLPAVTDGLHVRGDDAFCNHLLAFRFNFLCFVLSSSAPLHLDLATKIFVQPKKKVSLVDNNGFSWQPCLF
jgi:hypothetical protein